MSHRVGRSPTKLQRFPRPVSAMTTRFDTSTSMGLLSRSRSLSVGLAVSLSAVGVLAACGSSEDSEFPAPPPDNTSTSSSTSSSGFSSSGTSGNPQDQPITIDPPNATLTITSRAGAALTQQFVAKQNGAPITAGFLLDKYEAGSIDQKGLFTTTGLNGGKIKVTAKSGTRQATADLTVAVKLSEEFGGTPPSPGNKTALGGAPQPDPGGANGSKVLYPLDGTVMPRGLSAPVIQFSPGTVVPEDAKVVLQCSTFSWTGFAHVQAGATPQLPIPQDVWDAFMQSCGGEETTITIVKASGGVAYGPYTTKLVAAAATLKGAVFYQSYEGANLGLWSVRPGVKEPAKHLSNKCVVCHSVSANGEALATGMEAGGAESGTYKTSLDGNIQQISASPALQGDSRGLSFAFFTPDGKYVLRSARDFWGGANTRAFKVDKAGNASSQMAEATVNGLATFPAFLPIFSPDGKKLAFINGDGSTIGTARRSVSLMDAVVDPNTGPNGTLSFSNRTTILDNQAAGLLTKYPTFLPDSKQIVLQEGTNNNAVIGDADNYGGMLASYYDANTGKLMLLRGNEHIELTAANTSTSAADYNQNFIPTALPVPAGGYFWIVFTSQRPYGNTISGKKQLWVAAISPTSAANKDPSHAAFFLPNQSVSENERGFWALEPCKSDGQGCGTGDECCGGFCRPGDENNPGSAKVCKPPAPGQCAQIGDKCTSAADCCGSSNACIGGFCSPPAPK